MAVAIGVVVQDIAVVVLLIHPAVKENLVGVAVPPAVAAVHASDADITLAHDQIHDTDTHTHPADEVAVIAIDEINVRMSGRMIQFE